jgi:hypothetical protein
MIKGLAAKDCGNRLQMLTGYSVVRECGGIYRHVPIKEQDKLVVENARWVKAKQGHKNRSTGRGSEDVVNKDYAAFRSC